MHESELRTRLIRLDETVVGIRHELNALRATVSKGFQATMSQFDDVLAAIDTATTNIGASLQGEADAIGTVQTTINLLRSELSTSTPVTQAQLDLLASVQGRLSTAQSSITAQSTQLRAIAADPANPVPSSPPTTSTPPAV